MQMTSSERKRPHPWHDNRPFNPGEKKARSTVSNSFVIDFTEFTMSADYIYSPELVNTRYLRQTVGAVFQGEQGILRGGSQGQNPRPTNANRPNLTMQVDAVP